MSRLLAIIQKIYLLERKCPTCTFAEQCPDKPDKFNCFIQFGAGYVGKGYFICDGYERRNRNEMSRVRN